MSLVLEALRRVDRADDRPAPSGAAVTGPTRQAPWKRQAIPLVLGLLTGGIFVLSFSPPNSVPAGERPASPASVTRFPKGRAGLPPPLFVVADSGVSKPVDRESPLGPDGGKATSKRAAASIHASSPGSTPAPLVLQAVGERDSRAIAVINDQLVRVGDALGRARVVRIAPDFVELTHPDGRIEAVRFASPAPEPSPSPEPTARP